jgi:hypothetical protein
LDRFGAFALSRRLDLRQEWNLCSNGAGEGFSPPTRSGGLGGNVGITSHLRISDQDCILVCDSAEWRRRMEMSPVIKRNQANVILLKNKYGDS